MAVKRRAIRPIVRATKTTMEMLHYTGADYEGGLQEETGAIGRAAGRATADAGAADAHGEGAPDACSGRGC